MNRWSALAVLLTIAGAIALRAPKLDIRPLHNDEAVNAFTVSKLWQTGRYAYDPDEYHGPTLHYATLPFLALSGAKTPDDLPNAALRVATVVAGVALILLLWLFVDGVGRQAVLWAGVFIAISPAMVFYSRYFIHEMLLVFFTALALGSGWRYTQTGSARWMVLAGTSVGLMLATKETFVITLAAMGLAGAATLIWTRRDLARIPAMVGGPLTAAHPGVFHVFKAWAAGHWKQLAAAVAAAIIVWFLFFSSFGTHFSGLPDSIRTYLPWLKRAGGHSPHIHPWYFYFERLAWFHPLKGPAWSEALILALAMIGGAVILLEGGGRGRRLVDSAEAMGGTSATGQADSEANARREDSKSGVVASLATPLHDDPAFRGLLLRRFLLIYAVVLTGAYCAISYKTPWCLLSFYFGTILLAGIGAAAMVERIHAMAGKVLVVALLAVLTGQLAWQAWRASFVYFADRRNPYVYAQTVPDILNLVQKVDGISRVATNGYKTVLKVMAPNSEYWPLPWYLRRFTHVGWYENIPADPYAPIVIISSKLNAQLDERSDKKWLMVGISELRPRTFFELYVELELWKKYVATLPRPKDDE